LVAERGITSGLMAAPHCGQSAVPKGTSTRQREHAGNPFLLPSVTDVGSGYR
jgi:hypothetical protein